MIKQFISAGLFMLAGVTVCRAQHHTVVKLWETDSVVSLPESVLSAKEGYLFVSQMGNSPNDKDGIGGVAKISLTGKMLNADWITGLNAPKGLGRFGNILYAADLDEVIVMDIKRGKVIRKIPVEGAKFLNDITVDDKGIVYVSDSRTKKIHRIDNGRVSTYLENISGVNGLKAIGSDLYIATGKYLKKADKNKALT